MKFCNILKVPKLGFTLAEVLITLGIIGVVAAMTIPNLMVNIQKAKTETAIRAFQSKMSHALKLAVVDYGDLNGWAFDSEIFSRDVVFPDYETHKKFVEKYILPYMKTGATIKEGIASSDGLIGAHVDLMDGTCFALTYQNYAGAPLLMVRFFVNGDEADRSSRNMFTFMMDEKDALKPFDLNWDGKESTLITNPTWGCKNGTYGGRKNGLYCTKLLQLNNWKFPKNYPW